MNYRHELKYVCPDGELAALETRLRVFMPLDSHAPGGSYLIRSVYFDDAGDTCLAENVDGTSPREKWRVRTYDRSPLALSLECKKKVGSMCLKSSARITIEDFKALSVGDMRPLSSKEPLVQRLSWLIATRGYAPKVIVEYRRSPFVYAPGNVRVTLDRHIVSCPAGGGAVMDRLFAPALPSRPVLPAGLELLEVKFDEFLPDLVYRAVQGRDMRQTTFSKYGLCRRYSLI